MYQPIHDHKLSVSVPFRSAYHDHNFPLEPILNSTLQSERPKYNDGVSRPMELVPITNHAHQAVNSDPFSRAVQHSSGFSAWERHARKEVPVTYFEHKQQVYSPSLQAQSRLPDNFPVIPNSQHSISQFMPQSEVHEPSKSFRPHYSNSSLLSSANARSHTRAAPAEGSFNHSLQGTSIMLKPQDANTQDTVGRTRTEPTFDRVFEVRSKIPPSDTGPQKHMLERPAQIYEHRDVTAQIPRAPKLDCPRGIRGSFCNRIGENGFSTREQMEEHLERVHLLDVPARRGENRNLEGTIQKIPTGTHPSHGISYMYTTAHHAKRPGASKRSNAFHGAEAGQEVIHINSSPLMEER